MATTTKAKSKTTARKARKVSNRRAIQLSLDATSQIYYKVLAEILFTDVSKMIRNIVGPYAINTFVKEVLAGENLLNMDLLESFDASEDEIIEHFREMSHEKKTQILTDLVNFGNENGINYRAVADLSKV